MATKTETELATEVLEYLGVLGSGQSAEAADVEKIIRAYRVEYAKLDSAGLEYTYWEREAIPEEIFTILRDLVAIEVASAFGQPLTMTEKRAERTQVLRELRSHVGKGATGLPVRSEYF